MKKKLVITGSEGLIGKKLVKHFKNNISTQWLNDPDSTEIKNEFLDNAECIDAITYRFFQI